MNEPLLALSVFLFLSACVSLFVWPDRGLWWRWRRSHSLTARVLREDALKHLHRAERHGRRPTLQSVAGDLQIGLNQAAALLDDMERHGLITIQNGEFKLTPEGREGALHIIRAHRLWERYLADTTGFAQEEWHARAEAAEHALQPADVEALAARLGHPTYDPHGDPIPTADGVMHSHGGQPLTALATGAHARIVHLEDEPDMVYAQLIAQGLNPGLEVEIIEHSPGRIRFWANGQEHILAPVLATNVSVVPLESEGQPEILAAGITRLSSLKLGGAANVAAISQACRGPERRRLMDLGILPGTRIQATFVSASGDPTAYLVRDTLIALRRQQADLILVRPKWRFRFWRQIPHHQPLPRRK